MSTTLREPRVARTELSRKEKEMIAVGASLAAGCLPCTDYHARALREEEASDEEARQAAAIGLAVRKEATAIMAERARERFGLGEIPEPVSTAALCPLGAQIAIASATAAHSVPALRRFLAAAGELGLGEAEGRRAVGIGRATGETAAHKVDEAAQAATRAARGKTETPCGCEQEPAGKRKRDRR